jgi:hypothetical protein
MTIFPVSAKWFALLAACLLCGCAAQDKAARERLPIPTQAYPATCAPALREGCGRCHVVIEFDWHGEKWVRLEKRKAERT